MDKENAVGKAATLSKLTDAGLGFLDFHAHEQPLAAGGVQVFGPVVQCCEFEANPLKTSHQCFGVVLRYRSFHANDDTGTIQWVGELDQAD